MLKIKETPDGITICSFRHSDKLNSVSSDKFKREISEVLSRSGAKVVLDLGRIKFIDSSGFGALLFAHRHTAKNNARFAVCNIVPTVMKSLKILQLDKVLVVCDTVEDCLERMK